MTDVEVTPLGKCGKCGKHAEKIVRGLCKNNCYQKLWKSENRERYLEQRRKFRIKNRDNFSKSLRKYEYGITDAQYDAMMLDQDGRCAICYADDCRLCIDHCHASGRIRGLLCDKCNHAIGLLKEKLSSIYRAASYLTA